MSLNDTPISKGILSFEADKDVIGHLSVGLYRNFPRAIKELVSNSYDAGAKKVKMYVKNAMLVSNILDGDRVPSLGHITHSYELLSPR